MRNQLTYLFLSIVVTVIQADISAQNNVGIGTRSPEITAILDIADSNRGFQLPRTDTMSVENYVNSLVPNPGIAHGLTIYEVNMRTIYIYNGLLNRWQSITSLKGPQGPTGITGPTGPRGDRGIAVDWRDTAVKIPPIKREPHPNKIPPYFETLGDTCGDFYRQTSTGLIWVYDCNVNQWTGPIGRWRNFGIPIMESIPATGLLEAPMETSPGYVWSQLSNLEYTVYVPPDTVARIWITTEGNVQKKYVNYNEVNRLAFDYQLTDSNGVSRMMDRREVITVGPNLLIPSTTTSQFDKTPWETSVSYTMEGKISPAGSPLPSNDVLSWTFKVFYTHLFMSGNSTHPDSSRVIILDNGGSSTNQLENFAVMNIFVVYERSPNAPYPN